MHSPASTAPSPSLMAGCRKGSDFESTSHNVGGPKSDCFSQTADDTLQLAVSELNRMRRAQHDICNKLDRYNKAATTTTFPEGLNHPSVENINLLKIEKAGLINELENLRTMNVVQKERMQNEVVQVQKRLESAIREKEEILAAQLDLQQKLDQQRSVMAIICNHVKGEVSSLLKVEGLSELLAERFMGLIKQVDEAGDPSSLPEALLNKLADVSSMSGQLREVTQGLRENEMRVEDLTKFLVAQRAKEADLVEQLRVLKEALEQERERGNKAEGSLAAVSQRVRELEAELTATMKARDLEARSARLLEHEVREARLEKDMLKAALETAVCKANQQLQEQLESLRAKQERALAELAHERANKSSSDDDVRKLREDAAALAQALASEREAHQVEVNSLVEKNVQALKEVELAKQDLEALVRVRLELTDLTEKIEKLTAENARLKSDVHNNSDLQMIQDLQQQISKLEKEVSQYTESIAKLKESTEVKKSAEAELRAKLENDLQASQEELKICRGLLKDAEKCRAASEKKAEEAVEESQRLESQIEDLNGKLLDLQQQLAAAGAATDAARAQALADAAAEVTVQPQSTVDPSRWEGELAACGATIAALKDVESELCSILNLASPTELLKAVTDLKARAESLEAEVEELKKERSDSTEAETELQQRYNALQISKESLARQVESYAGHCTELEQQLQESQEELEAAEALKVQLAEEYKSKLRELSGKAEASEGTRRELEHELHEISEEHSDCARTIEELKRSVEDLKKELQDAAERTDSTLRKYEAEFEPARTWLFEKKFLNYVENAARESSTMATVNLTKKCTPEEIVANLRRACTYFAERSRGLSETETLLREELQQARAAAAESENKLREARDSFDDRLFQKDLIIDQSETVLNQLRAQLAAEKQRCEELSSELENQRMCALQETSRSGNVIEPAKRGQQAPALASGSTPPSNRAASRRQANAGSSSPVSRGDGNSSSPVCRGDVSFPKEHLGRSPLSRLIDLVSPRGCALYTAPAAALVSGVYMGIQLACLMK